MDRYKHKLPKDELKVLAKKVCGAQIPLLGQRLTSLQASKKVVSGDFKHKKVRDPGRISKEHQQSIKDFVKECFERHLKDQQRRKERKKRKQAEREAADARAKTDSAAGAVPPPDDTAVPAAVAAVVEDNESEDEHMSDDEPDLGNPASSAETSPTTTSPTADTDLKRKRAEEDLANGTLDASDDSTPNKKSKFEETPPPPPPPPPPPADRDMPLEMMDDIPETYNDATIVKRISVSFPAADVATVAQEEPEDLNEHYELSTEELNGDPQYAILSRPSNHVKGHRSPLQLATPNTVTPDDRDDYEDDHSLYDRMTHDRRQQLGVGGGS